MLDQTSTRPAPAPAPAPSTEKVCAHCRAAIPASAPGDYVSKFALTPDHEIICLECAANFDRAKFQRGEDVTVYCHKTSTGDWVLMNWPGAIFVSTFQRVTTSKHIVFGKTRTQRIDFYFKYGAHQYHGVNIGDNDLVHCKARKASPAPAPKAHYVALGGLHGYMPNFCEVFPTKTSAAQYIADIHELSHRAMLRLRRDLYVDLDLDQHGNEYGEIQVCWCDDPSVHSDSPIYDDL